MFLGTLIILMMWNIIMPLWLSIVGTIVGGFIVLSSVIKISVQVAQDINKKDKY